MTTRNRAKKLLECISLLAAAQVSYDRGGIQMSQLIEVEIKVEDMLVEVLADLVVK